MLSLNRFFFQFISKRNYLLAHYIVTFRSLIVTHKNAEHCLLVRHTSHVVTFGASRYVTSMEALVVFRAIHYFQMFTLSKALRRA